MCLVFLNVLPFFYKHYQLIFYDQMGNIFMDILRHRFLKTLLGFLLFDVCMDTVIQIYLRESNCFILP